SSSAHHRILHSFPTRRSSDLNHTEQQKRIAEQSRAALAASGKFTKPIVTELFPATTFYPAEDYHQDYYKKNPEAYAEFKERSGRAAFIRDHWKTTIKS